MRIIGLIPARYASTRFPGKPLKLLANKPIIQHVYEQSIKCSKLDEVYIATDDERIRDVIASFGGKVIMTASTHTSGTDRLAEASENLDADLIVNIQGDEPLIEPNIIELALSVWDSDSDFEMSTIATPITDIEDYNNPNVVKVVLAKNGNGLYFSRSPIPYFRNKTNLQTYRHIGLYVYRKSFLLQFTKLSPSPLEQAEGLEQLRALENGYNIRVVITDYAAYGIDTPEDLIRIEKLMKSRIDTDNTDF